MRYKIKFHNIKETELYFYHSEQIGSSSIDYKNFDLLYNSYTLELDQLEEFYILRASESVRITDLFYQSTDIVFDFESPMGFQAGDYLWIKDELFEWYGVTGLRNQNIFKRGMNGTRKHKIKIDPKVGYLLAFKNGRVSPLGLEFNIIDDDDLVVYKGYIKSINSSGAGIHVSIGDIIEKLKNNFYGTKKENSVGSMEYNLFDFIDQYCGFDQLFDWSGITPYQLVEEQEEDVNGWFYLSPEDWLNQHTKTALAGFVWNKNTNKYAPLRLSEVNAFDSVEELSTNKHILFNGGFSVSLDALLTDIKLLYNDEKTITIKSGFLAGVSLNEIMEIDCSEIVISDSDAQAIVNRLSSIFGIILGRVDITLSSLSNVSIGTYYNVPTEVKDLFFKEVEIIMQCVNISKNEYSFIILSGDIFNPVAPEIQVETYHDGTTQWLLYNNTEVSGQLEHYYISEPIALIDYNLDTTYFEIGEEIILTSETSIVGYYDILSSPQTLYSEQGKISIDLNGDPPLTDGLVLSITYQEYNGANTKEQKFLYNEEGRV